MKGVTHFSPVGSQRKAEMMGFKVFGSREEKIRLPIHQDNHSHAILH